MEMEVANLPEAKEKGTQKVQEFKTFVKAHPHVLKKVKRKEKTLQELFEEWMLFGEDDASWYEEEMDEDREEVSEEKSIGGMLSALKQMNFEEVQKGIEQFSGAVYSIQEVLSQFRSKPKPQSPYSQSHSPFPFRHD